MFFGDCSLRLNRGAPCERDKARIYFFSGDPRLVSEAPPAASRVGGWRRWRTARGGGGEKERPDRALIAGFFCGGEGRRGGGGAFRVSRVRTHLGGLAVEADASAKGLRGGGVTRVVNTGPGSALPEAGRLDSVFGLRGCGTLRKPRPGRAFSPPPDTSRCPCAWTTSPQERAPLEREAAAEPSGIRLSHRRRCRPVFGLGTVLGAVWRERSSVWVWS